MDRLTSSLDRGGSSSDDTDKPVIVLGGGDEPLVDAAAGARHHYIVVGHGREQVLAEIQGYDFTEVWQKEQKGTGHAAQVALPLFSAGEDLIAIMAGDAPLVSAESLKAMAEAHRAAKADLTLGVMELENPFGYGRIGSSSAKSAMDRRSTC